MFSDEQFVSVPNMKFSRQQMEFFGILMMGCEKTPLELETAHHKLNCNIVLWRISRRFANLNGR